VDGAEHHVGTLIRHWRTRRQLSQLDLAGEAGVSSRHVSFIETGRTQPSREMVLQLARALDVPLRDRNDLLTAAGFAPIYRTTDLDAPALTLARRALDFILKGQEPYPALVLDRHWNVLKVNDGSACVQAFFLDAKKVAELGPPNAMRLMFHPAGFRPYIVNWEPTAASLVQWLHRDVASGFGRAPPGAGRCSRRRRYLSRGSSASRRPSPKRLKPSTVTKMARPGKSDSQGVAWMNATLAFRSHPQLGVGGCVPSPRKDSVASTMMEVAIPRVVVTMIGARQLGRTWRTRMRGERTPRA